jgi:hypothetical protein
MTLNDWPVHKTDFKMNNALLNHAAPAMAGLFDDMTLRKYLRQVSDEVRTFTRASCTGAGQHEIDIDFMMPALSMTGESKVGLISALTQYSCLAVTSDVSGTSMLCRFLARHFASGKVGHLPEVLCNYLPLYLDLPNLDKSYFVEGMTLQEVVTTMHQDVIDMEESSFLSRLVLGSALVLLDNLDSLTEQEHQVAMTWVVEAQSWNGLMLVPTNSPEQSGLNHLPVLRVEGLSSAHIDALAKRRLPVYQRHESFLMQIAANEQLRAMAKDPALLWMMLDVQSIEGQVPSTQLEMTQAFLDGASKTVKSASPAKMGVPLYLQKNWLSLVGFHLHQRAVAGAPALATRKEIEGWIEEVLGEDSGKLATQNLSTTITKTALFIKARDGFGFSSQALLECCASQYVARHVVSPAFILGRKSTSGVSKSSIEQWSQSPAWDSVIAGVKAIIEKERDPAWMTELDDALAQPV